MTIPYLPGRQWLWQPEATFVTTAAAKQNIPIELHQAFLWQKSHASLRPWAEKLWAGGQSLKQENDNDSRIASARMLAYQAIKPIRTQSAGWLNRQERDEHDYDTWRKRHWWEMLVSEASAKMLWKTGSLLAMGYDVVLVDVDTLGILSYEVDPRMACPPLFEREGEMGGFRHTSTIEVNDTLVTMLTNDTTFRTGKRLLNEYQVQYAI